MPTIIRIEPRSEEHVIVKRIDLALSGQTLAKFGLMADGAWRRVGDAEPYPNECVLPVENVRSNV